MPRESADEKAARLLVDGRVIVLTVAGRYVMAQVQGDHGTYAVVHDAGHWLCSCENPGATCSHVKATMRVTAPARLRAAT